jgi:hypothetical protein
MAKNMLIHDHRLEGRSPTGMATNIYEVAKGVSTAHVFNWAGSYAASQHGLDNLFIMCHGYEAPVEDPYALVSTYALGYGLALGEPGLTFNNIWCAHAVKPHVAKITLFACGPANTRPHWENTSGDGMRFCGELALISGAEIIAAVQTQYYYDTPTWWQRLFGEDGTIDFGPWEGPVYRFSPDTGQAGRVL